MTTKSLQPWQQAIVQAEERFLAIDPERFEPEKEFARQLFISNELLRKCDPKSIYNAVVNIAATGATLNPALQQAYLIPRKGKCCLDFSYRGLIQLAVDSGSVLDMDASCVYENDTFSFEYGLDPKLKHIPALGDRGAFTYVYAKAILLSGIKKFIVLDKPEIEKIRQSAQTQKVWSEWYDEMARKTAIKKLYKMLPQSNKMSHAIMVVNEHEGLELEPQPTNAKKLMEKFGQGEPETVTVSTPTTTTKPPSETPPAELITTAQLKKLHTILTGRGLGTSEEKRQFLDGEYGIEVASTKDLTKDQAMFILDNLDTKG